MLFVVIREAGEGWDYSRSLREQDQWPEHAEFMDALTDAGVVVLGGPLGGGRPHRALQIMDLPDAQDMPGWPTIRGRPPTRSGRRLSTRGRSC